MLVTSFPTLHKMPLSYEQSMTTQNNPQISLIFHITFLLLFCNYHNLIRKLQGSLIKW